jgi:hypothetical protein
MNAQISPKDGVLLSNYLDGQLEPAEREALERRLAGDSELRVALISLERTRAALRSVPLRKTPHNFYLTQAMIQPTPWLRLAPILNFSSALAAVLLILSLFISAPRFSPHVPMQAAAPAAAQMTADTPTNTPAIIMWGTTQNQYSSQSEVLGGGQPQANPMMKSGANPQPTQEPAGMGPSATLETGDETSTDQVTPEPMFAMGAGAAPTEAASAATTLPETRAMTTEQPAMMAPPASDQAAPMETPLAATASVTQEDLTHNSANPILGLNPGGAIPSEVILNTTTPQSSSLGMRIFGFPYLQVCLLTFALVTALTAFLIRHYDHL